MLLPDEWRWLDSVTAGSSERYGMSGKASASLYEIGIEIGLRANVSAGLFNTSRWTIRLFVGCGVVYLASAPAKGKLNRPSAIWAGPALLGVFALLTLGFGGWMYCSCHRAAEDREWLLANGERITGEICGVLENRSVGDRAYRNTTYRLVARATELPASATPAA
jgi:hypothetical protein